MPLITNKSLRDYTGLKIDQVTVLGRAKDYSVKLAMPGVEVKPKKLWRLQCSCGNVWVLPHSQISEYGPRTCKTCAPKARDNKPIAPRGKYHKQTHPSYGTWYAMIRRCTSPKHVNYHRYGGRGITVCARWMDFDLFVEDMGIRPDNQSIDRKDNSKGYYKANCRWATAKEQRANQTKKTNLK
jgi:hypothetical protein